MMKQIASGRVRTRRSLAAAMATLRYLNMSNSLRAGRVPSATLRNTFSKRLLSGLFRKASICSRPDKILSRVATTLRSAASFRTRATNGVNGSRGRNAVPLCRLVKLIRAFRSGRSRSGFRSSIARRP